MTRLALVNVFECSRRRHLSTHARAHTHSRTRAHSLTRARTLTLARAHTHARAHAHTGGRAAAWDCAYCFFDTGGCGDDSDCRLPDGSRPAYRCSVSAATARLPAAPGPATGGLQAAGSRPASPPAPGAATRPASVEAPRAGPARV